MDMDIDKEINKESHKEIHKADAGFRKKLIYTIGFIAVVAAVTSYMVTGYVEEMKSLAVKEPELAFKKLVFLFRVITSSGAIVGSVFGVYFISIGVRVYRARRYPPPGARVVRDTRVLRGKQAQAMSVVMIVLSAFFVFLIDGMYFYFPYVLDRSLNARPALSSGGDKSGMINDKSGTNKGQKIEGGNTDGNFDKNLRKSGMTLHK